MIPIKKLTFLVTSSFYTSQYIISLKNLRDLSKPSKTKTSYDDKSRLNFWTIFIAYYLNNLSDNLKTHSREQINSLRLKNSLTC